MSNTVIAQKPKFSVAIQTEGYKKLINNTLQDPKRAQNFIAAISSAVATNPTLQECDAGTILAGALLGESLNLSPSPQLGQYYLVPFKDNKNDRTVATFILGYRGYVQLALRSGQYRKIIVDTVKKGELVRFDPMEEVLEVNRIEDDLEREVAETIGYYAMFEYLNGFRKIMYWSKSKMLLHAEKYSAAFGPTPARGKFPGRVSFADYQAGKAPKGSEWAYSSFWYKDFDGMAFKTLLRQLISKWGLMSAELVTAFSGDSHVIKDGGPDYFSGDDIPVLEDGMNSAVNAAEHYGSDETDEAEAPDESPDQPAPSTEEKPLSMDDLK
jgi:recombination protein RecT